MAANLIALDVGEQRVGVSLVRAEVRLAATMPTLLRQAEDFWQQLEAILKEYEITTVVVGLPRGLDGQL
jgi:putative transcription antitermination factor YqgF